MCRRAMTPSPVVSVGARERDSSPLVASPLGLVSIDDAKRPFGGVRRSDRSGSVLLHSPDTPTTARSSTLAACQFNACAHVAGPLWPGAVDVNTELGAAYLAMNARITSPRVEPRRDPRK